VSIYLGCEYKEYSDIPFFEPISKVDFPSEIKKRPKLPFVHFRMEIDVQQIYLKIKFIIIDHISLLQLVG
jgi:hypothetical protein